MSKWTERMRIELADVPVKDLGELRSLPASTELECGLYFLWLGDCLQYIGKSDHISNRLIEHKRRGIIPHDSHTCIVLDSGYIKADAALCLELKRLERAYIARYEPPFNCLDWNPGT